MKIKQLDADSLHKKEDCLTSLNLYTSGAYYASARIKIKGKAEIEIELNNVDVEIIKDEVLKILNNKYLEKISNTVQNKKAVLIREIQQIQKDLELLN